MSLMSEIGAAEDGEAVPHDVVCAVAELFINVYDVDGVGEALAAAVHQLSEQTEDDALAALLDWWGVSVGRSSTGACWNHLDTLPAELSEPMAALRDLVDKLPDGISPRAWIEARRELEEVMRELDYDIGYHGGNFGFGGERAAWHQIVAPYEELSAAIHAGAVPEAVPELSDASYRRIKKEYDIIAGSLRDRFMSRTYRALRQHGERATELAEVANGIEMTSSLAVESVSGVNGAVEGVARAVLRVLTGEEPPAPTAIAAALEVVGADADDDGRNRLSFLTWQWHEANAETVASLDPAWAARAAVLQDVRGLRRSLGVDELAGLVELVESEPDLSDARLLIEGMREQEGERGRRQSVLDRLAVVAERVEELDATTMDEFRYRLELIEADVADERLDDAERGLDELGPEVAATLSEVRRSRLAEIADELEQLASGVLAGAGLLAQEARAQIADLADREVPEKVIEALEYRLDQVRVEARRKVLATLEQVEDRADKARDGLVEDDRVRLQSLLRDARAAADEPDLPRAEAVAAQAAAFLDERVVRVWRADEGESELVDHLIGYLQQAVHFAEADIRRLHVALKTKRFVILAGLTGTGKSTIARLYAEAVDATTDNGRFRRVAVRPNWVDETEVLGYLNPTTGRFEPGWLAALIRTCHRDPDLPVFCVLDEMNLAPVEQYLADVLSAMEEQRTTTSGVPIQLYSPAAEPSNREEWPPSILFPENLFLIGTVNVDETTRPLSERVLDRANVLQLSTAVDASHHEVSRVQALNEPRWRVRMGDWEEIVRAESDDRHHEFLVEIAEQLAVVRIGMGIRSHLEIERFCANAVGILDDEDALDFALMQRVIPKIRGFKGDLAAGLSDLLHEFEAVGAGSSARVLNDWLEEDRSDDDYLDGVAATVGLAARG